MGRPARTRPRRARRGGARGGAGLGDDVARDGGGGVAGGAGVTRGRRGGPARAVHGQRHGVDLVRVGRRAHLRRAVPSGASWRANPEGVGREGTRRSPISREPSTLPRRARPRSRPETRARRRSRNPLPGARRRVDRRRCFFFPIITSRLLPPPDAASRFLDRSRDASPHETRPSHETHRPTPPLRLSPSAARGVRRVFGGPGVRVVRRAEPESGSQSAVHVPVRDVRVPRADQAGAHAAGPRGRVPRLRRAVRRHRAERPVHRRPRVRVVRGDGAVPLRLRLRRAL